MQFFIATMFVNFNINDYILIYTKSFIARSTLRVHVVLHVIQRTTFKVDQFFTTYRFSILLIVHLAYCMSILKMSDVGYSADVNVEGCHSRHTYC